ncbi:MAG: hypothetical protein EZS28_022923, partial [Streblomastix strix]
MNCRQCNRQFGKPIYAQHLYAHKLVDKARVIQQNGGQVKYLAGPISQPKDLDVAEKIANIFRSDKDKKFQCKYCKDQQLISVELLPQHNTQYHKGNPVQSSSIIIDFNTTWKLSDFIKIKKIGRGRFGTVFSMQEIRTQRIVAIKECDYDTEELKSMMNREIEVMKDIIRIIRQSAHQSQFIHVVEPLGFFVNEDEEKAYLVMELCSEGDLRSYIRNMKKFGTEISDK